MGKDKKKKEKITYIDDGRTIADMSRLSGVDRKHVGPKGTFRDQMNTYWNTVKLMFVPMLVTIGIICIVFFIAWILLTIGYTTNA